MLPCGKAGGERGIRTLGWDLNPINGLANRPFRPLRHLSFSSDRRGKRRGNKVQGDFRSDQAAENPASVLLENKVADAAAHLLEVTLGLGHGR